MNAFLRIAGLLIFSGISISAFPQLIQNPERLKRLESDLKIQQELAAKRSQKLFKPLAILSDPDEKQAMSFLLAYAPLSDLADYDAGFFLENVRMSLKARQERPWGMQIPEDVFLHFMLPVRVNNENLDSFRIRMYPELSQRIKGLGMKEAALEINHWCHEKVNYKGSDARTSSPLATIKTSWGRCGEESTFCVAAMRTAGIPARQVYTPRWAHCDDNHAWVEVWIEGKWYFLGACEPEPDLNMGWFAAPAKRAMLVHTRAYGYYLGNEPVITREDRFAELNLIANYAPVKDMVVKVLRMDNSPVKDALVEYRLYNYADLYPIAKSRSDEKGITGITTGFGDLVIWASKGNEYAWQKVSVETTDTLVLTLKSFYPEFYTEHLDLTPPIAREAETGTEQGRQENARRLAVEDSIRTAYIRTFPDSITIVTWAESMGIAKDSALYLIRGSYGNHAEIKAFISAQKAENRSLAMEFLYAHSAKDLRDARAAILHDHFQNALLWYTEEWKKNRAFYVQNLMCGRIATEMLLDWRKNLYDALKKELAFAKRPDVKQLIAFTKKNIELNETANLHSRASLSPCGTYRLGVADSRSRDIFFVAACRACGIPARLDLARSVPQYWEGGKWNDVSFEKQLAGPVSKPKAYLTLAGTDPEKPLKYETNFTLSRFSNGSYKLLEYPEEQKITDFPEKMEMDTGRYLLTTGYRLDDGKVLASLNFFYLGSGKELVQQPVLREEKTKLKPLGKLSLNGIRFQDIKDLQTAELNTRIGNKCAFIIWMDPDKEPTKHIMVDIPAVKSALDESGCEFIFLIPENKMSMQFRPSAYSGLPEKTSFGVDNSNRAFMAAMGALNKKAGNNFPYIIYVDNERQIFYYSEGYRIGIGEQMVKMLGNL